MPAEKIDRTKFALVMAYIAAGVQKSLTDAGLEVYYDLLGDLPIEALTVAAKRAVIEHQYATFPPVALIRGFAVDSMRGEVKAMTGAEAWGIALKACGSCDVESAGSVERAFAKVPETVKAAIHVFGFMALYNLPSNAIETARAQFIKTFESIAEREKKTGILPAPVQEQIAAIGEREANPALEHARAGVFKAIEG